MFGRRLNLLRKEKGYSLDELAEKYNKRFFGGLNKGTLSKYENGKQEPMITVVKNLADLFNVSIDFMLDRSDIRNIDETILINNSKYNIEDCIEYAVIGDVTAGYGCEAIEQDTGEYEYIPSEWIRGHCKDEYFVLRVKGDSMYPKFEDGDRVLVHRQTSVDSGSIAVVLYDSELATLKKVKYVYGEDWLELIPINPEYAPKRIENSDLEQCRILGEVRRLIRIVKE